VNELTLFLGRFHPLLVHFPIVLLVLAGVFELCAWWSRRTRSPGVLNTQASPALSALADSTGPVLSLGAISALAAAGAGYLLGGSGIYGGPTFVWHERLGVAVATGAVLTWCAWILARRSRHRELTTAVYRILLVTTIIVIALAGHLGATLTHGEGYLAEHAPAAIRGWLGRGTGGAAAVPVAGRPDQAVAYSTVVQPILARRCVNCHGRDRAEGKLRLDAIEAIRKGGEDGPVIVAGRAADSEMIRRIWLPPSHKDAMPPGGRHPVTVSEAAVLRWWIDQGAPADKKLGELEITAEVEPVIEAAVGVVTRGGPSLPDVNVGPPDRQAVAAAARLGVSVVPLGAGNHFIELHCTNANAFGDSQLAALRPLAPQTVWLNLSGTRITDAGLATVAQFKHLTRLHLNRTAVTDRGLPQLAGLQQLEYLNLYATRVSDAGLESLAALKGLRTLYVWQTRVSDSGLERLRSALPRLRVDGGLALASRDP
jgi:uncharacterized membrane protein